MNFDERMMQRLTNLEREVERLKVKESPDADKLDGLDSTDFGRPVFLTSPLTSTAWDGDAYSTVDKTLIDLSEVFNVPAGVSAVLIMLGARDSESLTSTTCYLSISPNNTAASHAGLLKLQGLPNDVQYRQLIVCPCNANGDIYYQIYASGTGTMDVTLEIWGYWL